ncbi:hypothetical protein BCV72DRAFT_213042 [Rhizopus microsporus var. microsporus]|uniref:PHD-domain-containing protein n=1 Tax=Rhizopus microsporus var. microsporus TaxID=86635 RepID=A0A1X0QUR6_RHIZD|nr:hypothetical protein BCV72DRAFT_213042 [Rhizopus microsporus var. microsporus]
MSNGIEPVQQLSSRRGRPRKNSSDDNRLIKQQEKKSARLQLPIEEQKKKLQQKEKLSVENKPREERSYKDFHPELDVKEPLTVVIHSAQSFDVNETRSKSSTSCFSDSNTIINGDAGNTTILNSQPKLPTPSFKIGSISNSTNKATTPSDSQLMTTVEYDMDEQDEVWLRMLNNERKKESLGEISADLFESIMDRLEKMWFDLVKDLSKNNRSQADHDPRCAICSNEQYESNNVIVSCEGCNLAVHQDCYGIPYVPNGQWLCRKCMVSPEKPVSCLFCPIEGGAFKQTTTNQWGHLLCAMWIPEVCLGNSVYMEPIDGIGNIPKSRWKLTCYICRQRQGACIQCDNKHCFTAFHVTCARWARLYMKTKIHNCHQEDAVLKAYCDRHTPKEYKERIDVDKSIVAAQQWFSKKKHRRTQHMPHARYIDEESEPCDCNRPFEDEDGKKKKHVDGPQYSLAQFFTVSKTACAHYQRFDSHGPVAPECLIRKLESLKCIRESKGLRRKSLMIKTICCYWSLKRESKRGTPLLKRLHLEPRAALNHQTKEPALKSVQKASSIVKLREDLEKVRILTEQVQKREKQKLERMYKQKAYLELILYPVEYILKPLVYRLME